MLIDCAVVWGHSLPPGRRAFHFTAAALLTTASIAYFCMASDLGALDPPSTALSSLIRVRRLYACRR